MAKKKVGVTIEAELHADVKSRAPKMHMLVEQAYEAALRMWLESTAPNTVIPPIDLKSEAIHNIPTAFGKRGLEWHHQLERILNSRHRVAIQAVLSNLVAFDQLVRESDSASGPTTEGEPNLAAEVEAILTGQADDRSRGAANAGRPRKRR